MLAVGWSRRAPRRFEPAGAGALLIGTTSASIGIGALVGWGAGSAAIGALVGSRRRHPRLDLRRVPALPGRPMSASSFTTPRPAPSILLPIAAGTGVIVLALPIYLVAGWRLDGLGARRDSLGRKPGARRIS